MAQTKTQSVRIIVDLQACQSTGSGKRGVGRYSHSLFFGLVNNQRGFDVRAVVAPDLPHEVDFRGFSENKIIRLPKLPCWGGERQFHSGEHDQLDALTLSTFIAPLKPDVIHMSHIFEGYAERLALPSFQRRCSGQIFSATLYDLIPLRFPQHYFQDDSYKLWYLSRLNWLRQADLLLAISESSRQDAISLLGIEPWRIVTIHGGVSPHFRPAENREISRNDLVSRYELRARFVLYSGGDDYRKNISGAISGYAALPSSLRKDCQLVIVCSMEDHRKKTYQRIATSAGLAEGEVLITGYVSEADMVAFYQACDAFIFPSLYEGLGLPVLEAMACGAPVVGGNNSSIRELIGRPDALFDAASSQAIADAIARVLTDRKFAEELRRHGIERARNFSWDYTAQLARDAFSAALDRTRKSGVHCAVNGWVARKRLAVLTPLPPCRSGIADYIAKFLPYLARYFDIDLFVDNHLATDEALTVSFRIFDVKSFEQLAKNYDVILYEFGNSEFHHHMLSLLEKFPGVVDLHDAYLSGLFGYLDLNLGHAGSYIEEMIAAHGPRARRFFAPVQRHNDPIGASMIELPCTKRVLDLATGVISHSPFNLQVAEENYPEGWHSPYRIIPQMVPLPPSSSKPNRDEERGSLGFTSDDIVISTFGHIAWTKWGDRLLDAVQSRSVRNHPRIHLVYVGELARDDFGFRLEQSIKKSGLGNRIRITGFLSESDYERYLRSTDIAVQLRTKSRGGTPKSVLDCLAHGLPVVVNDDASYRDYPDNVVFKLPSYPSAEQIADALETLVDNASHRDALGKAARIYVSEHHDPAGCAAEYAAAIHEFYERARQNTTEDIVDAFAPHLARTNSPSSAIEATVGALESFQKPSFKRRRLVIDVSHIAEQDHGTGIPRVVSQIIRQLYCCRDTGFEPIAVELTNGRLRQATAWLDAKGLLLPYEVVSSESERQIEFRSGDVLLMLDSSWARYREFYPVFFTARTQKVPIITVVYDLLPLTLPPGNIIEGGKQWFEAWFREAIEASDRLICISCAVANEVRQYIKTAQNLHNYPTIDYWHLGCDWSTCIQSNEPSQKLAHIASRSYLLMVGTIEPRKSHDIALAAMERLWKQGSDLCLCIAGKEGWMVDQLMKKLRNHPLLEKRVFLIENPSDQDIDYLYKNSAGLLFLSKGEGFGLPLVEAANYGIPILCSDIPVFHEIAGEYADYVCYHDPVLLADSIRLWCNKRSHGQLPNTRQMPRLTWEESAARLANLVFHFN